MKVLLILLLCLYLNPFQPEPQVSFQGELVAVQGKYLVVLVDGHPEYVMLTTSTKYEYYARQVSREDLRVRTFYEFRGFYRDGILVAEQIYFYDPVDA